MKRNIDEPSKLLLDKQSERDLLNAILAQGGKPFETHDLNVELFANPPYAQVYLAAEEVYKLGVDVNTVTVSNMLHQRGQLDGVGGVPFMSTLGGYCPDATPFVKNLHEAMRRRKLRTMAQMVEAAADSAVEVDPLIADINAALASLDPASKGSDVLKSSCEKVLARLERIRKGDLVQGAATMFPYWEHYFGGLCEGHYYGIGARPGMGKSAMIEQMIGELLAHAIPVCLFAQDMAPDMVIERMACRLAGVSKWSLDHGRLSGERFDTVEQNVKDLASAPLRLHCVTRMTGEQMVQIARREMRTKGVKHFFLDHAQTIYVPPGVARNEAWANASTLVRGFVASNPVSWVTLAHLNREAAKENAGAHQIRGFDDLLGDVDGLVLLDSTVNPSDLEPGQEWDIKMVVAKNRHGPCGTKALLFDRHLMNFSPDANTN
jgi:replicative DNA helicase